ncbi:MAG: hypothetical protein KatS3mg077_2156 [Candidatus Binatia bacterium]|nr:MAG: hypothetical protein KatS3mg077_2156 [Candidatus Binatia bacterium]
MKSRQVLVVCAATLVAWQEVRAGTLCDTLQQKGILSAEEASRCRAELRQSATQTETPAAGGTVTKTSGSAGPSYKVGSGFQWSSSETAPAAYGEDTQKPRFSMALGNRLQVRYTYLDPDVPGSSANSLFRIRRFKLFLNGNAFYPWLKYKLQADWVGGHDSAANTQRPELDDAFVDVAYFPFAAVASWPIQGPVQPFGAHLVWGVAIRGSGNHEHEIFAGPRPGRERARCSGREQRSRGSNMPQGCSTERGETGPTKKIRITWAPRGCTGCHWAP